MNYSLICGEKVSRLGLGTMRLPALEGSDTIDRKAAADLVEQALQCGVNFFDTSPIYYGGEAEAILGEALEPVRREIFLADKYMILDSRDYEAVCEGQLKRLRTDHIDFYMLHGVMDYTIDAYLESGCIDYFQRQKELGRIRRFGFSLHGSRDTLDRLIAAAPWDFASLQINYMDWKYAGSREQYEVCSDMGLPVIAFKPMSGSLITGLTEDALRALRVQHRDWSPAEWALRWFNDKRNIRLIIAGADTPEQLRENAKAVSARKPFNGPEAMAVNEVCEIIHAKQSIQCSSCFACCRVCPKSLYIPAMLEVYNRVKSSAATMRQLDAMAAERSPAACDGCGKCLTACVRRIDIPGVLAELAEYQAKVRAIHGSMGPRPAKDAAPPIDHGDEM